jgi:hypothetical protein
MRKKRKSEKMHNEICFNKIIWNENSHCQIRKVEIASSSFSHTCKEKTMAQHTHWKKKHKKDNIKKCKRKNLENINPRKQINYLKLGWYLKKLQKDLPHLQTKKMGEEH